MKIVDFKPTVNPEAFGSELPAKIGLMRGDASVLSKIAEKMDADETKTDFDSIPDVWFHAFSYEYALKNEALLSDFRQEYEKNWRVIFATVCLSELLGLKVKREPLVFGNNGLTLQGIAKSFVSDKCYFGDKMKNMPGFSWGNVVRYYYEKEDASNDGSKTEINIALSSPSTIIVPAPDAFSNLKEHFGDKIKWFSSVADDDASVRDQRDAGVRFAANDVPDMDVYHAADLAQYLHDFRLYLMSLIDDVPFIKEDNSVHQMLLNPIGSTDIGERLGLLRQYERDLIQTYGLTPPTDGVHPVERFEGITDIIVKESFFLFDIHVYMLNREEGSCALSGRCKLPFTATAFNSVYDLWAPLPVSREGFGILARNDFTVRYTCDPPRVATVDDIKALSIEIEVGSGDSAKKYRKTFNGSPNPKKTKIHGTTNPIHMCHAGIWPGKIIDNWKKYYFTCALGEDKSIVEYRPVSAGAVRHAFTNHTVFELGEAPGWLEALGKKARSLGYVPLSIPAADPWTGNGGTVRASVDFGTSSTTVYVEESRGHAKKLTDIDDIQLGVVLSAEIRKNNPLRSYALPPWNYDVPAASKMRVKKGAAAKDLEILINSNVLFPAGESEFDEWHPDSDIQDDMKWGTRGSDKLYKEAFFQEILQILFLTARLRDANQLHVLYSYPTAFSTNKLAEFRKSVENVAKDKAVQCWPGINVSFENMSEGEAATRRLAESISGRRCIVDIGGGTSDIFYYGRTHQGEYRAFDASITYASRDIFVDLFYRMLKYSNGNDILTVIGEILEISNVDKLAGDKGSAKNEKKHKFQRKFEDFLSIRHKSKANKSTGDLFAEELRPEDFIAAPAELRFFTSILTLCVSAVVYAAGMVARQSKDPGTEIDLQFAGNGAKILDWIWFNKEEYDLLKGFLVRIFLAALPKEPDTPQQGSGQPLRKPPAVRILNAPCEKKTEVAQGLLKPSLIHAVGNEKKPVHPIKLKMNGEAYRYSADGKNYRARSTGGFDPEHFQIRRQIDPDGNLADMVYTEELDQFLDAYNAAANALNREIKRLEDEEPRAFTLFTVGWDTDSEKKDISLSRSVWRSARYHGSVHLPDDEFTFNAINVPNSIEQQSLFIIGTKALYGLLIREFADVLKNKDQSNAKTARPHSPEREFTDADDPYDTDFEEPAGDPGGENTAWDADPPGGAPTGHAYGEPDEEEDDNDTAERNLRQRLPS